MFILFGSLNASVNEYDCKVTGVVEPTWKILSDSPAQREIYLKSSIFGKLTQRFYGTRWVENEDTAETVILVWPDIVALLY